MKATILLICCLLSSNLFGQVDPCSLLKTDFLQSIGKRVSLDTNFKVLRGTWMKGLRPFTYQGCQKDSMSFGDIYFTEMNLFINKRKQIKILSYSKSYSSSDTSALNHKLNDDFESILGKIRKVYNLQSTRSDESSDAHSYHEAETWQVKNHRIQLIKSMGQSSDSNGNFHYYLELKFW